MCLIKHHVIKTYGGAEVELHLFVTRHWMEMSGQSKSLQLYPRERGTVPFRYEARWVPEPVRTLTSRDVPCTPTGNRTRAIQPLAHHYTGSVH
jgi:hypothetical protein